MSQQVEIKKAHCAFCHWLCGVLVHVQDGKVVRVEGNREDPMSRRYICT